jgi:hypothetical protein
MEMVSLDAAAKILLKNGKDPSMTRSNAFWFLQLFELFA